MEIKNKVVYLHKKKTDNSVFYVGMGDLKRAYCKHRPKWWKSVVKKYGCIVEIYKDGLTKEQAFELEIKLIAKYGRIDLKNGQLINQTRGGISTEMLNNEIVKKKIKALKSVIKTKEWRNKISLALKGKVKSKEHIKNMLRPISCYDYFTSKFIANFSSGKESAKKIGCLESSISNHLKGRSKSVNSKILNKKVKFKYKWHYNQ